MGAQVPVDVSTGIHSKYKAMFASSVGVTVTLGSHTPSSSSCSTLYVFSSVKSAREEARVRKNSSGSVT